jgi:hypothetical protein
MGVYYFDQNDTLTLYVTPDMREVTPGEKLGVTYTAINRWEDFQPFWVLSKVLPPIGNPKVVLAPDQYTLPSSYTAQVHMTHDVPQIAPSGMYEYRAVIGIPPSTLYDEDTFNFWVVE